MHEDVDGAEFAETIAAIATAPGEAGIAILRISGPLALAIGDGLYRGPSPSPSGRPQGTFVHGRVAGNEGEILDDALFLIFRRPHSYTGEDAVEIQGHGGAVNARRILRRALDLGARPAEPGEFTRRAFVNGRIDLTQAEAVLDMIRAKSDRAAQSAHLQLEGALSREVHAIYDKLLATASNLEATLDFPDDELPTDILAGLEENIRKAEASIGILTATWNEGHLLRDGASVVIVGKPNVGKSTLLNGLLGRQRAIVSPVPGTTRDSIEEGFIVHGFPVRLIDTAGIRETECQVEREGIRRTREHMDSADIQIVVLDSSNLLDANELQFLSNSDWKRTLVVLNKSDLGNIAEQQVPPALTRVRTTLSRGEGLDHVRDAMASILETISVTSGGAHATISERHRALLVESSTRCCNAIECLQVGAMADTTLAAQDLRGALEALGSITGRVYDRELLDSIFSRFCIGK